MTANACLDPDVPASVAAIVRALCARAEIALVPPSDATASTIHVTAHAAPTSAHIIRLQEAPLSFARFLELLGTARPTALTLANGWSLHNTAREIQDISGTTIALTERETALLTFLVQHAPHEVSREALMQYVWAYDASVNSHTLETHIYRLRQKLEGLYPPPCTITTTEQGYCLEK